MSDLDAMYWLSGGFQGGEVGVTKRGSNSTNSPLGHGQQSLAYHSIIGIDVI